MRRKLYDGLKLWKNQSRGRSAILIQGARRVGVPRYSNTPETRT